MGASDLHTILHLFISDKVYKVYFSVGTRPKNTILHLPEVGKSYVLGCSYASLDYSRELLLLFVWVFFFWLFAVFF